MKVHMNRLDEVALVLRSRDPLANGTRLTSSPYVHRDLRHLDDMNMSLPKLCKKIPEISVLGRLKITASECYVTRTAIKHRYLILELRHGRVNIWMRLDRRRSQTRILSFFLATSQGPANDTVEFALKKEKLIDQGSTQENRQECAANRAVTLEEMRHFFALMIRELTHYQLLDANCWLFTGAVQTYLQQQTDAKFVSGRLPKSGWALKTRRRVMTAFEKLYNVPTASLVFEDLHERLEACIRHPMFNSYEQSYIVPALRKGIAIIENEFATGQQSAVETTVLSRELCHALRTINLAGAPSVAYSLTEIGIFLARSSHSMSLALPTALAAKAKSLPDSPRSILESRAIWRNALAVLTDRRQKPSFVQQYREFCNVEDLAYDLPLTEDEDDDESRLFFGAVQSVCLLGIEAETCILVISPSSCVSALVGELQQYAEFLELTKQREKVCSVWFQAVQMAGSCQCDRECGYKAGRPSERLSTLHGYYADSLMDISRIDDALEQYKAAVDALPKSDPLEFYIHYEDYSNAFINAGRVEESYNVLHNFVECAKRRIQEAPTQSTSYRLANIVKDLCSHPHIENHYDHQLRMLSDILLWLRADFAEHNRDCVVASLEREVLWDYANTLAILGHYEESEKIFAELAGLWCAPYEAEWDDDDDRPSRVDQWYFVVLDMYAKILGFNGKESHSRVVRKLAESVKLQLLDFVSMCASEIGRLTWEVFYYEDDPQHPPHLVYTSGHKGKARPAALLPSKNRTAQQNQSVEVFSDKRRSEEMVTASLSN